MYNEKFRRKYSMSDKVKMSSTELGTLWTTYQKKQ